MQGIQTRYKSVLFRSRVEAQWATFLDRLGVVWEYESVRIPGYLVDFHLPQLECFVEVKNESGGRFPKLTEIAKARDLNRATRKPVYIFFGELAMTTMNKGSALKIDGDGEPTTRHFFCACPKCGKLDITAEGFTAGHRCGCALPFGSVDGKRGVVADALRHSRHAFRTHELRPGRRIVKV